RFALLLSLLGLPVVRAADPIELRAGPLSLIFEPDHAFVRQVRWGEHLVLQGISAPVRDQTWGTVPPSVSNVQLERTGDGFLLELDVDCRQRDIDFFWHGKLTGTARGELSFEFHGVARSDFLRNRIGFCVLHGPPAAGRRCTIETVDGNTADGVFPTWIAPHQPFKNLRAIRHEVVEGVWATVRMEGDTFEMEDQRNWTDASFKTYCTPLEIPYPVRIAAGTRVDQRVHVSVSGGTDGKAQARRDDAPVVLAVQASQSLPFPGIGLQVSSQTNELSDDELERLRNLNLQHLRVDITPGSPNADTRLRGAAEQAHRLGSELIVGLHLGTDPQPALPPADTLRSIRCRTTWLVIHGHDAQVAAVRTALKDVGRAEPVGRGENTNFTELNRDRPNPAVVDVIAYGVNPQIHAFDNTSMTETLAIQGDTVRSGQQFAGERPLLVSPITLRPQSGAAPAPGELPPSVDVRQTTPFAASWTLGSVKYLAEAGVARMTYFETIGWLGVMEAKAGSPLPGQFPSRPGALFPVYHVLRELAEFAGGTVLVTTSSAPETVVALTAGKEGRLRTVIANLTPRPRRVELQGHPIRTVRQFSADDSAWVNVQDGWTATGQGQQGELPGYGILVVDN
ncbi:MAG: hypothetical protein AB7F89_17855, partial [Pirellulaceae bacterium]